MTVGEAIKIIKESPLYDNTTWKYAKKLHEAIRTVEQNLRWIPVSERMPEKYKAVIVTDIETNDTYQSQYVGNGYWECDNGLFMNRIIAWMPLPEPYKAERNEKE